MFACSSDVRGPTTIDMTLAQFTQNGELDVWFTSNGGLQAVISPSQSVPATDVYESVKPCPVLNVQASVNGVDVPLTSEGSGAIGDDPAHLNSCELPHFQTTLLDLPTKSIEVRVWDASRTWILRSDFVMPTASLADADALHIGRWNDIQVNPVPGSETSVEFDSDSGASSFMFDTNRGGQECETDFVGFDSTDAGVPCPIRLSDAGISIFVPNVAAGAGQIYVGGFSQSEVTDCEGTGTCNFHISPYAPPHAQFATSIEP